MNHAPPWRRQGHVPEEQGSSARAVSLGLQTPVPAEEQAEGDEQNEGPVVMEIDDVMLQQIIQRAGGVDQCF